MSTSVGTLSRGQATRVNDVAIVGCGYSTLERSTTRSPIEAAIAACSAALSDAGLRSSDIDGINIQVHPPLGTLSSSAAAAQLAIENVRWTRDGGMGIASAGEAAAAIEGRLCTTVLICKIMQMGATVRTPRIDPDTGGVGGHGQFEVPYGVGYTMQRFAFIARRYLDRYGVEPEQLAWIPVVQREHAADNPRALLRTPLTVDDYLASRFITEPLHVLDCDLPVTGACAYVMTTRDRAADLRQPPVYLVAWGEGDSDTPDELRSVPEGPAPWARDLFGAAAQDPADVRAWYIYDGFSYMVPLWLEDLGLVDRGGSASYVYGGDRIRRSGEHPLNTHGGSLSEGRTHGHGHIIEAVLQLRGGAGPTQVEGCDSAVVTSGYPMSRRNRDPWTSPSIGSAGVLVRA